MVYGSSFPYLLNTFNQYNKIIKLELSPSELDKHLPKCTLSKQYFNQFYAAQISKLLGSSNSNEVGNMTLERMKIDDRFYTITMHLQTLYNGKNESFEYITPKKVLEHLINNKSDYNKLKDELGIKSFIKITKNKDVQHLFKSGQVVSDDDKQKGKKGMTKEELYLKTERSNLKSISNYMSSLTKYYVQKRITINGVKTTVYVDKKSG